MIIDPELKKVEFLQELMEDLPVTRLYYNNSTYVLSGANYGNEGDLVINGEDRYIIESVGNNMCELREISGKDPRFYTDKVLTTVYPIDDNYTVFIKEDDKRVS